MRLITSLTFCFYLRFAEWLHGAPFIEELSVEPYIAEKITRGCCYSHNYGFTDEGSTMR